MNIGLKAFFSAPAPMEVLNAMDDPLCDMHGRKPTNTHLLLAIAAHAYNRANYTDPAVAALPFGTAQALEMTRCGSEVRSDFARSDRLKAETLERLAGLPSLLDKFCAYQHEKFDTHTSVHEMVKDEAISLRRRFDNAVRVHNVEVLLDLYGDKALAYHDDKSVATVPQKNDVARAGVRQAILHDFQGTVETAELHGGLERCLGLPAGLAQCERMAHFSHTNAERSKIIYNGALGFTTNLRGLLGLKPAAPRPHKRAYTPAYII